MSQAPPTPPTRMLTRVLTFKIRRPRRRGGPDLANRSSRRGAAAELGFGRLTVVPAIGLVAWLIPALPLLLAGDFAPVPVLLIAAPLAAALSVNVLHRMPDRWPIEPGAEHAEPGDRAWMPLVGLIGVAAVAAGFMFWQLALSSPSVFAVRPPGAFFQTGYWIAQHGSLPIPGSLAAFGGHAAAVHLSSAGFYQDGGSVVPGVLAGLPMLLAAGFWTSGAGGGAVIGPVLGGLAVLSFGGLVGRLAGRQWAPAGALALAVTLPELYTSRDAFGEPAVQVLLFGGLSLVIDALTLRRAADSPGVPPPPGSPLSPGSPPGASAESEPQTRPLALPPRLRSRFMAAVTAVTTVTTVTPERMLAGLGGLAVGLTSLFSLVSLAQAVLPAIVAAGVVLAGRRLVGIAFCAGLCAGVGYGLIAGYALARPLMDARAPTLTVIGIDAAIAAALAAGAFAVLRSGRARGLLDRRPLSWLPGIGAAVVAAVLVGLLVRPLVQTVRGTFGAADTRYVGLLQHAAGLRPDPTRLYAEDSLYWVIWYVGLPAVLLGGFGAAVVVRRCLRSALRGGGQPGVALNWVLPLAILLGGSAAVLWQPFTVPDQPWASRRLAPVVLPAVTLLATWAAGWLVRFARGRGAGAPTGAAVGALCVAALLVPALSTSFGVGLAHTGVGGGLHTSAGGLAQHRVGSGQTLAVQALCGAIGRSASVLIVDPEVAAQFAPAIRGICGVPVAWTSPGSVPAVVAGIVRSGRHPVILGARASQVRRFGGQATLILRLVTTQYPHVLTQPPGGPLPARYEVWMTTATTPGAGV